MKPATITKRSTIAGIAIPDSTLANDATAFVRDIESDLLYHHSLRVFVFGSLQGQRRGLAYDPEMLYVGAMFHDVGLVEGHRSANDRFEVDGANAARDFLAERGIPAEAVRVVWDAIALHTTPGIPEHKEPEVALVTAARSARESRTSRTPRSATSSTDAGYRTGWRLPANRGPRIAARRQSRWALAVQTDRPPNGILHGVSSSLITFT
jgi:hypothetical protein